MDRRFAAILVLCVSCLAFTSCGLDQKGMVLMTDPGYKASVIGKNGQGFTVGDGLLWHQGRLYIADEGGSALRVWSGPEQSTTLGDEKNGFMSPEDLVMDGQGNIFFSDDDAGGVWKVNNLGEVSRLATKENGIISSEGIALAPDGSILVGDGEVHQVFRVTQSGQVSVFLGKEAGIKKPESMVYDELGNLFIADNEDNVLYKLTPDGKLHRTIENQKGFSPETIWYANGVLYITDSHDGKLFRYTPTDGLDTIAVFGGKLASVNGVTTDEKGDIYLSVQTDLKHQIGYLLKLEPIRSTP